MYFNTESLSHKQDFVFKHNVNVVLIGREYSALKYTSMKLMVVMINDATDNYIVCIITYRTITSYYNYLYTLATDKMC